MNRVLALAVSTLAVALVGCSTGGSAVAEPQPTNAVAITSARQLADAVGCTAYESARPAGFTDGGDCTVGGVAFHLYLFASNSDRNALVNGIFKTSGNVNYGIGDRYAIASLDEATTKVAAAKIGATVQ